MCVTDCPQVQCIQQYVAKQADELSLEPSDIINVIRKTTSKSHVSVCVRFTYSRCCVFWCGVLHWCSFVLYCDDAGWWQGIRLSDQTTGWFPHEVVKEVTNEHQRRRNLREQYRIAKANNHSTTGTALLQAANHSFPN